MTEYNQQGQHVDKQFNITGEAHIGQIGDRYGLSVEEVAVLVVELKRADQPVVWDGRLPYLGLESFRESDAGFFFGREKLVDELLERVRRSPFVVIAGPSGSGKSSVARAGLFHALRQGRLERSDNWLLASMRPQGDPIGELAVALERATQVDRAGDPLRAEGLNEPGTLGRLIGLHLGDDPRRRFVLLVDQFEEVFTQTHDEAARAAFIHLLTAAAAGDGRAVILLALRADFVSHCARYPDLRAMLNREFQLVGAMDPPDLAKAITLPGLEVGAAIDPALVSRVMTDMKGEPGALPLMSFALRDLFEAEKTAKGQSMDLTLREYLNRGGIESALERHANSVFATFTAEQQGLARSIFSRLIEVGQGRVDTRRTVAFEELVPAGADPALVAATVAELAEQNARLLTTSGAGDAPGAEGLMMATVTIAHEKLIDAWPWLRKLVDEDRGRIKLQNDVADSARIWESRNRDNSYLYTGARLEDVEKLQKTGELCLDSSSTEFVAVSVDRRKANERIKRLAISGLGLLAAAAITAAVFAFIFAGQSKANLAQATVALVGQATANARAEANLSQAQTKESEAVNSASLAGTRGAEAGESAATAVAESTRAFIGESRAEANANRAEVEARQAEARELAARSLGSMDHIPEQGLLLAFQGAQKTLSQGEPIVSDAYGALYIGLTRLGRPLATLRGHTGFVNFANFSYDGTRIITVSSDQTARIWDNDGQPLAIIDRRIGSIYSAVFSPDGTRILTAGEDTTARLWDGEGQPLAILGGHSGPVVSANFSPDGTHILTASIDGDARLWDGDGQFMLTLKGHDGPVVSAVFSPDGTRIVTAGEDNTARLWDSEGQSLAILEGHTDDVRLAVFSPDGTRILTASEDTTARLWDGEGQPLATLEGLGDIVVSAVFSPDGTRILTASGDITARLWDREGKPLAILEGHSRVVSSAVFSPDGTRILTSSYDRTARLWDGEGQPLAILAGHSNDLTSGIFSPDGTRILTTSIDNTARLWDGFGPMTTLADHTRSVNTAVFSPDGMRILTASVDNTARLWGSDGQLLATLAGHNGRLNSAVFSPDGRLVLTNGIDGTARLWDSEGQSLAIMGNHTDEVYSAEFSPDGTRIVTAGGMSRVWDLEGQSLVTLEGSAGWSYSAVFSPDGTRILTTSRLGPVQLFDGDGQSLAIMEGHRGWVYSAAFSPDGTRIVTAGEDQTARLWDSEGKPLAILEGHTDDVMSAVFSPDGTRIVTAGQDQTARLWDSEGKPLFTLARQNDWVRSAVFSPDGTRILTAGDDGTARLWNEAGRPLAILEGHSGPVYSAVFSPDGTRILTAGEDGTARIWQTFANVEAMLAEAEQVLIRILSHEECVAELGEPLCP